MEEIILNEVLEEMSFLDINIENSITVLISYYSIHGIFCKKNDFREN